MGKAAVAVVLAIVLAGCGPSAAIVVPATVDVPVPAIHDTLYTTEAYDEALWTIDSLIMELDRLRAVRAETTKVMLPAPPSLRVYSAMKVSARQDTIDAVFHLVRPRPWFDIRVRYKPFSYQYDQILDDFVREARPHEKPDPTVRWLIVGLSALSLLLIVLLFISLSRRGNG